MPLFRFNCRRCGKDFELFLRVSEARALPPCPYCRATETERAPDVEGGDCLGSADNAACGPKKAT
jgi:putative FmdB family regulatory protein